MVQAGQHRSQQDAQCSSSSPWGRTPSVTSEISLAAVATAVGCARVFVASMLDACSLTRLLEDARLVASELVTNAVQATGITDSSPRWSDLRDLTLIRLRLLVFSDSLIVEVWDREAAPPAPQGPATPDAENGRGLLIVEALSRQWNYYGSAEGGKWVWAKLVIPSEPEPLPKRERPAHPPTVRVRQTSGNLAILRRVRDGLRRALVQEMKYPHCEHFMLHAEPFGNLHESSAAELWDASRISGTISIVPGADYDRPLIRRSSRQFRERKTAGNRGRPPETRSLWA